MKLVLGFLILAIITPYSCATYCVCKPGVETTAYQKAIDYACGAGADCNPIKPNGQCYNPNSLQSHCSFAANSYFQINAPKGATCDFQGTAILTNSDPSGGGCSFSSSSGSTSTGGTTPVTTVPMTSPTTPTSTPVTPVYGGGGTTPITPVSGSGTPTSGTPTYGTGPTTTSPYTPNVGNPTSTGVLGGNGFGSGLGPTGSGLEGNYGVKLASFVCEIEKFRSEALMMAAAGMV